jgi:hypothetical protein
MLKLPASGQGFKTIRKHNLLYVDKTKIINEMVSIEGCYFLSRPRRFGKSLLLGTIAALFEGDKELFDGLWIASDAVRYEFKKYPILTITMPSDTDNIKLLNNGIMDELRAAAEKYDLNDVDGPTPAITLKKIVRALVKKTNEKVVVLIDEYDEPIRSQIHNIPQAIKNRDALHSFFYSMRTLADKEMLHFLLVTGVTKFSKASIFSGFNNLNDITMNPAYHSICGFTLEEFDTYFKNYLPGILEYNKSNNFLPSNFTVDNLKDKIIEYYDGYSWDGKRKIINPYTLINFIENKEFQDFWFDSGTPTFLLKYIKQKPHELTSPTSKTLTSIMLNAVEINRINLTSLLFQTGYLTITGRVDANNYSLDFPNHEVSSAFNSQLFQYLTDQDLTDQKNIDTMNELSSQIKRALVNFDSNELANCFSKILTWVKYAEQPKKESYHHAIIYAVLRALSFNITSQFVTSEGVCDFKIEMGSN